MQCLKVSFYFYVSTARISRQVPNFLMKDSAFIADFCYGKMSQAIRSETDKLLVEQCSSIILNMARYGLTKENAFQV